jgi:hypothetical protein
VVEDWSLKTCSVTSRSGRARGGDLRCATAGRLSMYRRAGRELGGRVEREGLRRAQDLPFTQVRAEWMRNHEDATKALDATPPDKLDES